jgi:hypothetical protein
MASMATCAFTIHARQACPHACMYAEQFGTYIRRRHGYGRRSQANKKIGNCGHVIQLVALNHSELAPRNWGESHARVGADCDDTEHGARWRLVRQARDCGGAHAWPGHGDYATERARSCLALAANYVYAAQA